MRALKMRSIVTGHWKLTTTNWDPSLKLTSYTYVRSCQRTQHQPFYGRLIFKASWKSGKAWEVGASWADHKSKTLSFWSIVLTYSMQQWTISQSDCDVWWKVDFILQLAMTNSVVVPRISTKALPKAKLAPRKGHGSLFGGLLPVWSTRAFWIPAKPLYLRSMLNKSMRWRGLVLHNNARVAQSTHQRLNKLGCEVLPHLPYSHDHSPTNYHFFKHLDNFLQGKCFHNQQEAEKCTDFYATGINELISHWQKCVDCNGSYFD